MFITSTTRQLFKGCLILLITGLIAQPLWAQGDAIARVVKSQGTVLLKRQADAEFVTALQPAMDLFNGDAIRSGEGGFASVIFIDDKTLLKVKDGTQFQFIDTPSARTIDLQYGSMRSTLPQPIKSFRVETPVSVASVKGTDFWLIHNALAGTDRAYGMEGIVEILNTISGIAQNLTANTMIVSTAGGQVTPPIPITPDDIPTDPDEAEPEPEPEPEETEEEVEEAPDAEREALQPEPTPELGGLFVDEELPIDEPVTAAEAEAPAEAAAATKAGPGLGLGLGSVTIDGNVYYQIALRPEFKIWKFGIGLDLVGYMDAQGKFRDDEWDEPSDYLDKLMYLRFGTEQDPFFFKIGSLPQVQYGFGAIMNNYSNMTEFPQVRRVGFEVGGQVGKNMRLKGFTADLKDMGGVVGLRGSYRVSENFPLTLGVNVVADLNQYSGLKDKDDDGVPDLLDDFPEDDNFWVDSDGDGLADNDDSTEFDIDGDGWTDNSPYPNRPNNDIDGIDPLKPEPFSKEDTSRTTMGISVDLSYPIISSNAFSMVAYTEAGILNYGSELSAMAGDELITAKSGFGLVGPGLRAQILKFLNLSIEYRQTSALFQPGFFNTTYDIERAQFISSGATQAPDSVVTKDEMTINNGYSMSGYYANATANLFSLVDFSAGYQDLTPSDPEASKSNSFISTLNVNTDIVPKISEAMAYYIRTNDKNPFKFKEPSSNTTWGYKVGYELGPGVSLVYGFQESYRDLNGNGMIDLDSDEKVTLLTVETAFSF
jgi:hypothetical protein